MALDAINISNKEPRKVARRANTCEQALQGIGCGGAVATHSPSLGTSLGEGVHTQWIHVLTVLPDNFVSDGKKIEAWRNLE